ncbi:MAG: hypothetical protein D6815_10575 [Candidatus Dadabacteria bacterium]|nr:MAG: hypothetical protein D6815_10575 [Candidatus Dadabacteria bacterium]
MDEARRKAQKVAAALAAVQAYLEEEKRATASTSVAAPAFPSPWLIAGRLAQIGDRVAVARRFYR